ncbi:MAG: plastocyanin/azurin family copper-binding protein [Gaiellaceae bacterium]
MAVTIAAVIMVPTAMAAKKPPKLKATFGAGLSFDIKKGKKLVTSGGNGAMTVKAKKYRLIVNDGSSAHNFRLVNSAGKTIKGKRGKKNKKVLTSVSGTRKKATTYVVKLKKGSYTLVCDPHVNAGMTVDITVN